MKVDYTKVAEKVKFWKDVIENVKDFTSNSPPAVFVGKAFYPRVYVGILAPTTQQSNTDILDFPEKWYEQKANIEQILNYRGQLIYSRFKSSSVKKPSGKLVDVIQELAMAKKPTTVEIHLKKNPRFTFNFDGFTQPIGNPAPIKTAILTENPSVERRLDYIISDFDLKAQDAVVELYKYKLPVSRIQRIFSAGLLGLQMQRKFVPTKWSITAVDDTLGKILIEKIKNYQELSDVLLFHNEYLANHFEILLIPEHWRFEMIEAWNLNFPYPTMASDYENYWGRDSYATEVTGGYYAARIGVLEYLEKIKRQAAVLIVREIKPGYWCDVGVWKVRETVRDAFTKPFEKFYSLESAIKAICQRMVIRDKWKVKSKLLMSMKEQHKIVDYFKKSDLL